MARYKVTGKVTHHTTDDKCCSVAVEYTIPEFYITAGETDTSALEMAKKVVCPFAKELQYESVTFDLKVEYRH